jgi:hypothetical protein
MTLVEAFMFPGDGQIIATATAVGVNLRNVAAERLDAYKAEQTRMFWHARLATRRSLDWA